MKKWFCIALCLLLTGCSQISEQSSVQSSSQSSGSDFTSSQIVEAERAPIPLTVLSEKLEEKKGHLYELGFSSPSQLYASYFTNYKDKQILLYDTETNKVTPQDDNLPYEALLGKVLGRSSCALERDTRTVRAYDENAALVGEMKVSFPEEKIKELGEELYFERCVSYNPEKNKLIYIEEYSDLSNVRYQITDPFSGSATQGAVDFSGIFETEEFSAMLPDEGFRNRIEFNSVNFIQDNMAIFVIWCVDEHPILKLNVLYDLEKGEILSFQTGDFYFYSGKEDQIFALSNLSMEGTYTTERNTVWQVDFSDGSVRFVPCDFEAQNLVISSNGDYLLTVYDDYESPFAITVRDASSLQVLEEFEFSKTESLKAWYNLIVAISNNGQSFLIGKVQGEELYLIQKTQ